jgi:hypothetical protein
MDNIIDLIATDSPASSISDAIKNEIFAKAAEKIDSLKSSVADSLFDMNTTSGDNE